MLPRESLGRRSRCRHLRTIFGGGGGSGPLSTTTTLSGSPNPANVGDTVTLAATETASDNSHPAGSVQFEADGSNDPV